VTLSATVLAYQITLPQLWSGFQVVGDGTGTYDFAVNAVILGSALILFTTTVNAYGVKLMARINSAGVFIGEGVGLIRDVPSAAEIVERVVAEAEAHLRAGAMRVS